MQLLFPFSCHFLWLLVLFSPSFAKSQAPTLVWPKHDMLIYNNEISFRWNISPNSTNYNLQVATTIEFTEIILDQFTVGNTLDTALDLANDYYFWRIISSNDHNNTDTSFINSFRFFDLSSIENLTLWLASDSLVTTIDDKVSHWADLSGNEYHAIQNSSSNRPEIINNSIAGKPAIKFNGQNSFLTVNFNKSYTQPNSYFIVWNNLQEGANRSHPFDGIIQSERNAIQYRDNSIVLITGTTVSAGYLKTSPFDYIINTAIFNGNNSKLFENSILSGSGNPGSASISGLTIGSRLNQIDFLNGEITEILMFDELVDENERSLVETYLKNKYAPPVNLGFDIHNHNSFCPIIIDAGNEFVSYQWNTGATTQSIEVSEAGIYSVSATNIFGKESTDSIVVTFPDTRLHSSGSTLICLGDTISISPNLLNLDNFTYEWNTGDTSSSINIVNAGDYWVIITDEDGCFAFSDTISTQIDDFPSEVLFDSDQIEICAGNYLEPINSEEYSNYSFLWNTGSTNPSIAVFESGQYSLNITNENNCIASDQIFVNIIGIAPTADFNATTSCFGEYTEFIDVSESATGDEINSWQWFLGDTIFSDEQNPNLLFSSSGEYLVTLEIEAESGCASSIEKDVMVLNIPQADFFVTDACIDFPVYFFDSSSAPEGESIIAWFWDFGDDNTSSLKDPINIFEQVGLFDVQLITFLENGCSDTISYPIEIPVNLPDPEFFTLVYPKNHQLLVEGDIPFSWNLSENSYEFYLEVAEDSLFQNVIFSKITDDQNFNSSFFTHERLYWRVTAYNACRDSLSSEIFQFDILSASILNNATLWLNADSLVTLSDGKVSEWKDLSGNNFHAIQNSPSNRPIIKNNALGDYPAIKFNGQNSFLVSEFNQSFDQPNTYFVVWNNNHPGSNRAHPQILPPRQPLLRPQHPLRLLPRCSRCR
jgi:hypothetical protein